MPSFDIVSEINSQEIRNAVDQANREIDTRFDFKGSQAKFELNKETITLTAQDTFQLKQMIDILVIRLSKRNISIGSLKIEEPENSLHQARQIITVLEGIDSELAKTLVKTLKNGKLKIQAAIQGEQVRVTGKKRDDLQDAIALIKEQKISLPLQFINFRD
ncbi:MAG: hypothetical protein LEGION0398_MBIBDBAK_00120 [Legionellaceae bacterium]